MKNEIWKDIPEYEGFYQSSNLGRVKSVKRIKGCGINKFLSKEIILVGSYTPKGYLSVNLYKDKKRKTYLIHRLIAITFIQNPDNKPQINHINGIKDYNISENLEWCTSKENRIHAFKIGIQKGRSYYGKLNNKSRSIKQFDLSGNYIKTFDCMSDAKRETGATNIHLCAVGKRNKSANYIWKY